MQSKSAMSAKGVAVDGTYAFAILADMAMDDGLNERCFGVYALFDNFPGLTTTSLTKE